MRRRLPPYGRQVLDRLAGDLRQCHHISPDGRRAQIFVAVGPDAMGWPPSNPHNLAVAIPAGDDPLDFRFDWAAPHAPALIVLAPSADPELVHRTAAALIRDGAACAVAVLPNGWARIEKKEAAA